MHSVKASIVYPTNHGDVDHEREYSRSQHSQHSQIEHIREAIAKGTPLLRRQTEPIEMADMRAIPVQPLDQHPHRRSLSARSLSEHDNKRSKHTSASASSESEEDDDGVVVETTLAPPQITAAVTEKFLAKQQPLLVLEFKENGDAQFREMRRKDIYQDVQEVALQSALLHKKKTVAGMATQTHHRVRLTAKEKVEALKGGCAMCASECLALQGCLVIFAMTCLSSVVQHAS